MVRNPGWALILLLYPHRSLKDCKHIVSRQSELTKAPVVITVGKIKAGVRNNIIPEECIMVERSEHWIVKCKKMFIKN